MPSSRPRADDRVAVRDAAAEHVVQKSPTAASLARSGASERSTSWAISLPTSRSSGGRRLVAAGAVAQLAHHRVGHRQLEHVARPTSTARSSSGDAQATASTLLDESSTITLASSARAAARATSGRPAPDSTASETAANESRKSDLQRFAARCSAVACTEV